MPLLQRMRVFQKNLDELSARMSTVESVQKSWRSPSDVVEANEMQEQLQVPAWSLCIAIASNLVSLTYK